MDFAFLRGKKTLFTNHFLFCTPLILAIHLAQGQASRHVHLFIGGYIAGDI